MDFFLDTYDSNPYSSTKNENESRGQKPSERVPYLERSGRGKSCRVIRKDAHETKAEFLGEWFPRNDDVEEHDLYCAWMLAFFVPWREVRDICPEGETFHDRFQAFYTRTSDKIRDRMQNIQYYWQCINGAKKRREDNARNEAVHDSYHIISIEDEVEEEDEEECEVADGPLHVFTEEDVELALTQRFSQDEQLYANVGMAIAEEAGIFKEGVKGPESSIAKNATMEDIHQYRDWEKMVLNISKRDKGQEIPDHSDELNPANVQVPSHEQCEPDVEPYSQNLPDSPTHLLPLYTDQLRAHDIVANNLRAHLKGVPTRQLLMIVRGTAGTGKSLLLNAITKTFESEGAAHLLFKTAMSGVAASLIGGSTLHWWGGIPAKKIPQEDDWMDSSSKAIKQRREENIAPIEWLAVDEISMMTTSMMALISQVAGKVRNGNGAMDSTVPFGGLNLILIGDFHQFEPVANPRSSLYSQPRSDRKEKLTSVIGRNLWAQFETVVTLTEQKRIIDPGWMETLQRSRTGDCNREDLHEIRKLVLTNPECHVPDFNKAPWDEPILVTPRNSMRAMWNSASLTKHCQKTGQILYICNAEDTVGRDQLALDMEQRTTVAKMSLESLKGLDHRIEIAIGMKAMVTANIATQADLANGSRGIIADIVLDGREDVDREQAEKCGVVELRYPPALVVFEPYHHTFPRFPGLKEGQIPMFPQDLGFTISTTGKLRTKIHRRQYPLTPAYAFTDHKAQGQTLEYLVADIGPVPEKFGISPLGAYVALSRGRGREQIRLLRDFDDDLFTKHPSEDLRIEDERLDKLTELTKEKWDAGFYD